MAVLLGMMLAVGAYCDEPPPFTITPDDDTTYKAVGANVAYEGEWYMGLMEAEAAAHWASRHGISSLCRPLLRRVSQIYTDKVTTLDIEDALGRLEKHEDWELGLVLLAIARTSNVQVKDYEQRAGRYVQSVLTDYQCDAAEKVEKRRWANDVVWLCQDSTGALHNGLALLTADFIGTKDAGSRKAERVRAFCDMLEKMPKHADGLVGEKLK